jgi:hypothetical protein
MLGMRVVIAPIPVIPVLAVPKRETRPSTVLEMTLSAVMSLPGNAALVASAVQRHQARPPMLGMPPLIALPEMPPLLLPHQSLRA